MSDIKTKDKHLKIALGTDNFREMATEYDVFIDKTPFIKEIIDTAEKAILITYPRRWGKTLNLDMLKTFFEPESKECDAQRKAEHHIEELSILSNKEYGWQNYVNPIAWYNIFFASRAKDNEKIDEQVLNLQCNRDIFIGSKFTLTSGEEKVFSGLQISTIDSGKYMRHQGKYPVIFLSLKDVIGNSVKEIEDKLRLEVSKLFSNYVYLYNELHSKQEKNPVDDEILQKFTNIIRKTASIEELKDSIRFLSELLHKRHGERVYILIDEYDKPVNSLLEEYIGQEKNQEKDKLIKETVNFISQTICGSVSKTNPHLEKLILIGIFDTTQKESGSGCNNIKIFGISDSNFSRYFGFSEDEVRGLVAKFKFTNPENILAKIKDWYNGYSMPISTEQYIETYTPWAVMNYLNDVQKKGESFLPQNYWTQSGASTILQNLFKKEACVDSELSNKLQNIISQNSLSLEFDQHISLFKYGFGDFFDNEKIFTYLLLNSGYLTTKKDGLKYVFSIPNFEVRQEFVEVVENQIKSIKNSNYDVCSKLLDDLHKKQHIEVFSAIKSGNQTAIDRIFKKGSKIKCSDEDLNFNYFHVASLSKNVDILNSLLSRCSDNIAELLNAKDKVFGLNVKDYMQLNNNLDQFQPLLGDNISEVLKAPTTYESILCNQFAWYGLYSLVVCPAGTAAVKFVSKIFTPKDISSTKLYLTFVATGTGVTIAKDSLKYFDQYKLSYCKEYGDYHGIDTKSPQDFNSLRQFKKYYIENEQQVYVALGNSCNDNDTKLQSINTTIFDNPFYGTEELTFTLCGSNVFENSHSEL